MNRSELLPRLLLTVGICASAGVSLGDDSNVLKAREKTDPAASAAATPADKEEEPMPPLSAEAAKVAEELDRSLPADSEARAMYEDIFFKGSQLGPTDGWFRTAVAQTRFGWPVVKARYDRDGDDAVSAEEFGGAAADFDRLDRDGDGKITESDLTWKDSAQTRDPAMLLFRTADTDVDGRVTPEEFSRFFEETDTDGAGFLTLDDVRGRFARLQAASNRASGGGPDRDTLVRALARQELGSLQPGPYVDEPAPDFTLSTFDGSSSVTLSEVIGPKPVVLVFGNFTCGPFRQQSGNVEKLFQRYKDRATFLMVYVREAHPTDGWHMESNEKAGVSLPQPKTYEERVTVAERCRDHVKFGMPFLVDTIDDQAGAVYSGMPSRLYVIDEAGTVAYKSGRGPFGFKPAEMEQSLLLLLNEDSAKSTTSAAAK